MVDRSPKIRSVTNRYPNPNATQRIELWFLVQSSVVHLFLFINMTPWPAYLDESPNFEPEVAALAYIVQSDLCFGRSDAKMDEVGIRGAGKPKVDDCVLDSDSPGQGPGVRKQASLEAADTTQNLNLFGI